MSAEPPVPLLGAPTATGKSDVALELAERFDLEIVSADAMQVYREMDVGTAKPTPEQRAQVPHHGIDLVDPDQEFSVADWVRVAESAIAAILARGRTPFVVGGTGFYVRALSQGLPTVPSADPDVQAPLWDTVRERGLDPLLRELEAVSPRDAERAQRNPRRVVRALEIVRRTGKAPSEFPFTDPAFRYAKVVLLPPVDALRPRIEARTERMFAAGLVDEVRRLLARYPSIPTAMQAIGYKEVAEYLAGRISLEEAKAAVSLATHRYAKRQRTWFRREPGAARLPSLARDARPELSAWLESWPQRADWIRDR